MITRYMCENVSIKTQAPVHFLVIPKSPKPGISDAGDMDNLFFFLKSFKC